MILDSTLIFSKTAQVLSTSDVQPAITYYTTIYTTYTIIAILIDIISYSASKLSAPSALGRLSGS
jgi:hypothetical protein